MGGSKSKDAKATTTSDHFPKILLFGSTRSGKTVFIKSLAGYTQQNIYSKPLEFLISRHCIVAFSNLLYEMNQKTREEVFTIQPEDSPIIQDLKRALIASPSTPDIGWLRWLDEFTTDRSIYLGLWNSSGVRKFVDNQKYNVHNLENLANYDKFFQLIGKDKISEDLLKYISPRDEPISDLTIKLMKESYILIDAKKKLSRITRNRGIMWAELNENARLGIFLASTVNYDKDYFEGGNELDESLELFKDTLTNRYSKSLRIIVIFTMADLLPDKLAMNSYKLGESTNDRVELKQIENFNTRVAINSLIDRYQNVFEYSRVGEKFEYHLINTLSEFECFESLVESTRENSTRRVISSSLLGTLFENLFGMIRESKLSDLVIIISDV